MEQQVPAGAPGVQQVFPPPPAFYRLYHPDADGSAERPIPPPPPEPVTGEYTLFGELNSTEVGIPPLTVQQLYTERPNGTIDFRGELLRLNREALFAFAELLASVGEAPSSWERPAMDLMLLLRNMHHLLNMLRRQQALATVEHTMRLEIAQRTAAIEELRRLWQEAEAVVQSGAAQLVAQAEKRAAQQDENGLEPMHVDA